MFYFKLAVSFSGKLCDEPPTMKLYSPGSNCHPLRSTLKIERYFGSTSTTTSLLSPPLSLILLQPTRRFGGSAAAAGSEAYTSATSAPARLPVFVTVNVTRGVLPGVTFRFEYE